MSATPADPTSLENLYDIVMPPPVPWWPPAPGWYVVGGAVLVLVIWAGWRGWKCWQDAAYRRAALAELQRLKGRAADNAQRESALQELPELVKCTALAAFPREQVASLSGASWLEFLDRTGHTDAFTTDRANSSRHWAMIHTPPVGLMSRMWKRYAASSPAGFAATRRRCRPPERMWLSC